MAWQRLLRVGVYAAALASFACADARAVESTAQPGDAVPTPPKKPARSAKAAKLHHRVKAKRAVAGKPKARSIKAETGTGQLGYASWYGGERHGKTMASGARFDKNEFTAAHRTLPLHSKARVTNVANGRSVTVQITDRGPSRKGRLIDLSQSAAEELGMRHSGVARVRVEPIAASALP
jgi:rare lipoprotein A